MLTTRGLKIHIDNMREIIYILVLAASIHMVFPAPMFAQIAAEKSNTNAKGIIIDKKGEPLMGAIVRVKGSNRGTATNMEGRFVVESVPGDTLEISYVGYKPMKVEVTEREMSIMLAENDQMLSEVVVTALGMRKEKKS